MRKSLLIRVTAIAIGTTLIAAAPTQAIPVEPSDFGPAAVTESFESLPSDPTNMPTVGNGAFLKPAVTSSYTFGSGVILTGPVPNSSDEGPVIGDFARGDASVCLSAGNTIVQDDVPSGTAYMITGGDSRDIFTEFTFTADMLRVGAYLGGNVESVTIALFDSADVLLKETHLLGVMPEWKTNFIGFENPAGIRRITIDFGPYSTGTPGPQHLLIDGLMFEQIPEPATAILLALGSLALLRNRCRPVCPREGPQK